MSQKLNLNLYYRQQCHLCEDMLQLLQPYIDDKNIQLEMIDIDTDPKLQKKYTVLIPVLTDQDENEICHYFFDKISFEDYLNKVSKCINAK